MYQKLIRYPHLKVLNRPIRRLEMDVCKQKLVNGTTTFIGTYDDAHFHRSYLSNKGLIEHVQSKLQIKE